MMRRIAWTILGAALIVAGITAAWTETQPWLEGRGPFWIHHGPMGYGPMGFVARQLNLNDTQKSQIKSIWEGERPNIAVLLHEFASEQREMDALPLQDGAPDDGRVQDIATREGATLRKLLTEKETITGRIYSQVLNPAQRAKADELRNRLSSRIDHAADWIGGAAGRGGHQ